MSETQSATLAPAFNRLQRKQINKVFREIFNTIKRTLASLEADINKKNDKDALVMVEQYHKMKTVSNPTLEQKFQFLEAVCPEWSGM